MAEADIQDLIIIKRRSGGEMDGLKGGVWKIAFADFMTAMMCFFLVMWLINAANQDTRQAVASYFNPVRLAELNRKGLTNPHATGVNTPSRGTPVEDESEANDLPSMDENGSRTREALFNDPYKVLTEIAGVSTLEDVELRPEDEAPEEQVARHDSGDPFDVGFRAVQRNVGAAAEAPEIARERSEGTADLPGEAVEGEASSAASAAAAEATAAAAAGDHASENADVDAGAGEREPPPASRAAPMSTPPDALPAIADSGGFPLPSTVSTVSKASPPRPSLEQEIADAVAPRSPGERNPRVTVEQTGGGSLISLTDDVSFGMFAVGSAEPQPQMVRIMERIARILKERGGTITIRGHTDARPFRSGTYDNWRLSTDRAQMAYYMLVRGGLEETRVGAIEGYADRVLKRPGDPEAAENRRIEIFLNEASE